MRGLYAGCQVAHKADDDITHNPLFKNFHNIENNQLPEVIIWVHVVQSKDQIDKRLPAEGTKIWLV